MVRTNGAMKSHQVRMISSLRATTRSSIALSELPLRSNLASTIGSDSSANGLCSRVSIVRWRKRATPALSLYTHFLFSNVLSMNSAWPWPAGDHSTRQWLTRSGIVVPPSLDRRTNEFSPVITGSCGSTNLGSDMGGALRKEFLHDTPRGMRSSLQGSLHIREQGETANEPQTS